MTPRKHYVFAVRSVTVIILLSLYSFLYTSSEMLEDNGVLDISACSIASVGQRVSIYLARH